MIEKMVGRVGLLRASCPPPFGPSRRLLLHSSTSCIHAVVRYAAMFKFAPGEFVEPTTNGLKDSCLIYQVFINQSLAVLVHLQRARKR